MSDTPLPRVAGDRYDVPRRRRRRRTIIVKERPSNGEKLLLKWILGILAPLAVMAIPAIINILIQQAEGRKDIQNLKEDVAEIKAAIAPRYRGQPQTP